MVDSLQVQRHHLHLQGCQTISWWRKVGEEGHYRFSGTSRGPGRQGGTQLGGSSRTEWITWQETQKLELSPQNRLIYVEVLEDTVGSRHRDIRGKRGQERRLRPLQDPAVRFAVIVTFQLGHWRGVPPGRVSLLPCERVAAAGSPGRMMTLKVRSGEVSTLILPSMRLTSVCCLSDLGKCHH